MLKSYSRFFEHIRHLFILRTTGRILGFIAALMTALFWHLSWAMMVFIVTSVISDTYFFLIKKMKESDFKAFETKCQALHFKSENYNKYALAITWSKITVLALWLMLGVKYTYLAAIFPVLAIPYSITMLILTPILMFATGAGSKATLIAPQPSCPYAMQNFASQDYWSQSQAATTAPALAMGYPSSQAFMETRWDDFNPFPTPCHNMTGINDFMQPVSDIASSTAFPIHDFSSSTIPNLGMPGFNVAGAYTGSDTAIGGISN
jgi:hypothetical protein